MYKHVRGTLKRYKLAKGNSKNKPGLNTTQLN